MITSIKTSNSPISKVALRRTVAVVDMVSYSNIARMLEENMSAYSVAELNAQIQSFMENALASLAGEPAHQVVAKTGDGIIVLFERPDDAHRFGCHVQRMAKDHNDQKSEPTAERWFRVGIATGEVIASSQAEHPPDFAGTTIANAVRLESAAKPGEIIIDTHTFAALSGELQSAYGQEDTVSGKRSERFRVRRFEVTACSTKSQSEPISASETGQTDDKSETVASKAGFSRRRKYFLMFALVIPMFAVSLFSRAVIDRARRNSFANEEKPIAMLPVEASTNSPKAAAVRVAVEKHIALLPLDMSTEDDAKAKAVGDGIMDSLAGRLFDLDATEHSLWIIPASEVRAKKVTDSQSAMRVFGATIVVKGQFDQSKGKTRLQLTVIDPATSREIGHSVSNTETGDLFSLQDDAIAKLIPLMDLRGGTSLKNGTAVLPSRGAYEEYLAGVGYLERMDKPGNIESGIEALQHSVGADPHFAPGFARLAQAYLLQYRLTTNVRWLDRAQGFSHKAVHLRDEGPSTYVALGQIHLLKGKREEAYQDFEHALRLDARDTDAWEGIGDYQNATGHKKEAEDAYRKRIGLRPDAWAGYNSLGNFYLDVGRVYDALAQFEHGLTLAPDNSWLLIGRATAYSFDDNPANLIKAEEDLKRSIAFNPTFVAYNNLSLLYLQLHRFQESVSACLDALRLNDRNAEVWANLASAYEWLAIKDKGSRETEEKASQARLRSTQLYEQIVREHPKNKMAHANLAELYAKSGQTTRARNAISISLALAPQNQYVLLEIADAYELLHERSEALTCLRQAVRLGLPSSQIRADPQIQGLLPYLSFSQVH